MEARRPCTQRSTCLRRERRRERVFRALIEASPADLTIGGGADPVWMPEAIAATRATVLSVPNANHSLTIPGDWRASLEAQQTVFESIAEHIERR